MRRSWEVSCAVLLCLFELPHEAWNASLDSPWRQSFGCRSSLLHQWDPIHMRACCNSRCLMTWRSLSPAQCQGGPLGTTPSCAFARSCISFFTQNPATPPTCCAPNRAHGAPLCQTVAQCSGGLQRNSARGAGRHGGCGGLKQWAACNHAAHCIRHAGARPSTCEPSHNLPLAGDHGGSTNTPTPLTS